MPARRIVSAGKTGTAQAVGIAAGAKYNAAKMEERRRDHALYMAYAPADDPKIAVAVIVENAGFGAAAAAPIARRVFDYWLLGQYPSEEDMAAMRLGQAGRADRHAAPGGRHALAGRSTVNRGGAKRKRRWGCQRLSRWCHLWWSPYCCRLQGPQSGRRKRRLSSALTVVANPVFGYRDLPPVRFRGRRSRGLGRPRVLCGYYRKAIG